MGLLTTRARVISTCLTERIRHGIPEVEGPLDQEVLFTLDGVGGFEFTSASIRRAMRLEGVSLGTVVYRWQFGLFGEIWTDLMWLRRNRVMGARLARRLLAFRRAHPTTRIHMLAVSGGAGIGAFACEYLRGRRVIDTLILACPALSPTYNLGPALASVERCYAMISQRDRWVLGLGTRLFGTTDRRFGAAAGLRGFRIPTDASSEHRAAYERMREMHWSPAVAKVGHYGGHTGFLDVRFLRAHVLPMLKGEPLMVTQPIPVEGDRINA